MHVLTLLTVMLLQIQLGTDMKINLTRASESHDRPQIRLVYTSIKFDL